MSYVRVFPTDTIKAIECAPNDVQQEQAYMPKASLDDPDPVHILNYWAYRTRKPKTVMLHFAVNRLAGMQWGEPDLAPLLPWLARYASWLEDRVRLNRYRNAFMFQVKAKGLSAAEKDARQIELNSHPPTPGSVLVTDDAEEWDVIAPKLDAFDANSDGLTLKKYIASGHGVPLALALRAREQHPHHRRGRRYPHIQDAREPSSILPRHGPGSLDGRRRSPRGQGRYHRGPHTLKSSSPPATCPSVTTPPLPLPPRRS